MVHEIVTFILALSCFCSCCIEWEHWNNKEEESKLKPGSIFPFLHIIVI